MWLFVEQIIRVFLLWLRDESILAEVINHQDKPSVIRQHKCYLCQLHCCAARREAQLTALLLWNLSSEMTGLLIVTLMDNT